MVNMLIEKTDINDVINAAIAKFRKNITGVNISNTRNASPMINKNCHISITKPYR